MLDAISAEEDANWVWQGAQLLRPDLDRALISLSVGGADATVVTPAALTETFATFVTTATAVVALYLALDGEKRAAWWFAIGGALLAWATLTRPDGMVVVITDAEVVVVERDGEVALRELLSEDEEIEMGNDFAGGRKLALGEVCHMGILLHVPTGTRIS